MLTEDEYIWAVMKELKEDAHRWKARALAAEAKIECMRANYLEDIVRAEGDHEAELQRLRAALREAKDYVGTGYKPAGLITRIHAALKGMGNGPAPPASTPHVPGVAALHEDRSTRE